MKKIIKNHLSRVTCHASLVMLLCFLPFSVFAQGGTFGPLTWKIENRTLTISGIGEMPNAYGYSGPWCIDDGSSVHCPFDVVIIENGVTSIGERAFAVHAGLQSISIPNSVTKIESCAFCNSTLHSIILPNNVTIIKDGSFASCDALTTIILPNRNVDFGINVFKGCEKLTSITNPNPIPQVISPKVFNDPDGYVPIEFNFSACTLKVPFFSVELYKRAPVWKEFNIVGISVDIDELEITNYELRVYPNPTTGTCSITIPAEFLHETALTLSIYDAAGTLVQQIQINNNEDFSFKLAQKAKGVYLAVLSNGKRSYRGRVVFN